MLMSEFYRQHRLKPCVPLLWAQQPTRVRQLILDKMEDLFICLLDCDNSWVPEWVCKLKIDSFRSNAHIGLSGTSTPTTEQARSSFSNTAKDLESAEDDDDNAFEDEAVDCRCAEAKQWLEESLAKPKPTKKKRKIQRTIPPRVRRSTEDLEGNVAGTTRSILTEEPQPK